MGSRFLQIHAKRTYAAGVHLAAARRVPRPRIRIAESLMGHWLPCRSDGKASSNSHHGVTAPSAAVVSGTGARRLLGEGTAGSGHRSTSPVRTPRRSDWAAATARRGGAASGGVCGEEKGRCRGEELGRRRAGRARV
ncbi:hypothetical protein [Oryza sativa Japonica Group]|uniref:Uncharacterized protein n=1 Tax=Oryza sativa subsp. japonica TaxID=39947 RepID=Q5Z8R5_ORYSJ|nr:hypothetical protein [Oryza sativa Japonica Group]